MDFLIYELRARALCLGERAKGNLFKPCLETIPFSAISGALSKRFGGGAGNQEAEIKAVGFLQEAVGRNRRELLTCAPRDRVQNISKIPLQVEFLQDVLATIVIVSNHAAEGLPDGFSLVLGGMRSHGFGQAELKLQEKRPAANPNLGSLRVRLPEDEAANFGIVKVEIPVYGYLFKPTPGTHTGVYVRSLFEGSRVIGPAPIVKPFRE